MKYSLLLTMVAALGLSACQKKPADAPPTPEVVQPATPPATTPPATQPPEGSTKPADTPPAQQPTPEQQR